MTQFLRVDLQFLRLLKQFLRVDLQFLRTDNRRGPANIFRFFQKNRGSSEEGNVPNPFEKLGGPCILGGSHIKCTLEGLSVWRENIRLFSELARNLLNT